MPPQNTPPASTERSPCVRQRPVGPQHPATHTAPLLAGSTLPDLPRRRLHRRHVDRHERYLGLVYTVFRGARCFKTVARKYDFASTPKAWIGIAARKRKRP